MPTSGMLNAWDRRECRTAPAGPNSALLQRSWQQPRHNSRYKEWRLADRAHFL
jgi:hypothetical protein